jgi:hypothetical protein
MRETMGFIGVMAVMCLGFVLPMIVFACFRARLVACHVRPGVVMRRDTGGEFAPDETGLDGMLVGILIVGRAGLVAENVIVVIMIVVIVVVMIVVIMMLMLMVLMSMLFDHEVTEIDVIAGFNEARARHIGTRYLMAGMVGRRTFGRQRRSAFMSDDLALDPLAVIASASATITGPAPRGAVFGFFLGFAMGAFVRLDQGLSVGDRNLIIVGVDFTEGKESVTVSAVFDEGGLQRRFDPRYLGEIDISAELLALGGLEIKFFDAIAADHHDPGFFRMGGIDQHLVGHLDTLGGGAHVVRPAQCARRNEATVHLIRG